MQAIGAALASNPDNSLEELELTGQRSGSAVSAAVVDTFVELLAANVRLRRVGWQLSPAQANRCAVVSALPTANNDG